MTGPDGETEDIAEGGMAPAATASADTEPRNRLQYAALPFRVGDDGAVEVLLITSRTTRRWIIPKGWPMGKLAPRKVAATEASEEAGVEGSTSRRPIGRYGYDKVLSNGTTVRCAVDVYALEVQKQRSSWPERKRRERRWVPVEEAADMVSDTELAAIVRAFATQSAAEQAAIGSGAITLA
ncbi:NUDIX hydrolase [Phreatobacter sp.]|uniref:NUDIX hydrolase n=1 Tax=Phreatobacter sp. TaxID=1966341 RepID=UPI0022BDE98B|nr:NUDIX hydrolase [Phreatobacter sp.]MCZ8315449.1 NUDIX hydrolase [Phreatobacter sp.]